MKKESKEPGVTFKGQTARSKLGVGHGRLNEASLKWPVTYIAHICIHINIYILSVYIYIYI